MGFPHVELVSTCDIIPERAKAQAGKFKVPNQYPNIDQMLAGAAFDLLVNLTDMQEHERLNRQAIEAGLKDVQEGRTIPVMEVRRQFGLTE